MLDKKNKLDYYLKITLIVFFVDGIITHLSPEIAMRSCFIFDLQSAFTAKFTTVDNYHNANPYIHETAYAVTYKDPYKSYPYYFVVRKVGFLYFPSAANLL
ncbi:MAG TPA: hypothetical protein K8W13_04055 [Enterococcus columbae]|nr:hypothetical protein [Enterococcus columbae]